MSALSVPIALRYDCFAITVAAVVWDLIVIPGARFLLLLLPCAADIRAADIRAAHARRRLRLVVRPRRQHVEPRDQLVGQCVRELVRAAQAGGQLARANEHGLTVLRLEHRAVVHTHLATLKQNPLARRAGHHTAQPVAVELAARPHARALEWSSRVSCSANHGSVASTKPSGLSSSSITPASRKVMSPGT
eukprot:7102291-Prymnesium_polylepis.1